MEKKHISSSIRRRRVQQTSCCTPPSLLVLLRGSRLHVSAANDMYPSSFCAPTAKPSPSSPDNLPVETPPRAGDTASSGGSPGNVALSCDRSRLPPAPLSWLPPILFPDPNSGVFGGDSRRFSPAEVSDAAAAVAAASWGHVRDFWPTLCFSLSRAHGRRERRLRRWVVVTR